jgi:hypothetical protein
MSKRILASLLLAATTLLSLNFLLAQTGSPSATGSPAATDQPKAEAPIVADQDIQLMRQDLRAQKKQIVAANMTLTPAEAEKFWPVYDQYTAETTELGNARYATIKEYADNYQNMTDPVANSLVKKMISSDQNAAQLRLKYVPIFEKVISPTKTALFFQIDRRVAMMIDLQLASQIPLVPAK